MRALQQQWTQKTVLRDNNVSGNSSLQSWHCSQNNPSAQILPNGTVVLVFRANKCSPFVRPQRRLMIRTGQKRPQQKSTAEQPQQKRPQQKSTAEEPQPVFAMPFAQPLAVQVAAFLLHIRLKQRRCCNAQNDGEQLGVAIASHFLADFETHPDPIVGPAVQVAYSCNPH